MKDMQSLDIEALNQQIYIDSAFIEKLNETGTSSPDEIRERYALAEREAAG